MIESIQLPLHQLHKAHEMIKTIIGKPSVPVTKNSGGKFHPLEDEYLQFGIRHPDWFDVTRDCSLYRFVGTIPPRALLAGYINEDIETITQSGFFMYKPGSYMGWHTNINDPGVRVYITYSSTGDSFFRYMSDGKIHTSYDEPGITIRKFNTEEKNPLWHCVGSNCLRISIGFKVNKRNIGEN